MPTVRIKFDLSDSLDERIKKIENFDGDELKGCLLIAMELEFNGFPNEPYAGYSLPSGANRLRTATSLSITSKFQPPPKIIN